MSKGEVARPNLEHGVVRHAVGILKGALGASGSRTGSRAGEATPGCWGDRFGGAAAARRGAATSCRRSVGSARAAACARHAGRRDHRRCSTARALSSMTDIVCSIDGITLERKATIRADRSGCRARLCDRRSVACLRLSPMCRSRARETSRWASWCAPKYRRLPGQKDHREAIVRQRYGESRDAHRHHADEPAESYPSFQAGEDGSPTMTLIDGSEQRSGGTRPSSVVRGGQCRPRVLVADGGEHRSTTAGQTSARISGRQAGRGSEGVRGSEKIVTDGAFHLNNERKRSALGGEEGS